MSAPIDVAEADRLIAANLPSFGTETVPLEQASGRILRRAAFAERDHPAFDRVMMDGIALRWADPLPDRLPVAGAQMAGMERMALPDPGACLEVTTGAIVPEGCDCVVPVEQTLRDENGYTLVAGYRPARNQFIHPRGSDCRAGTLVVPAGSRLDAPQMAQLAANGVAQVAVAAVSIAILATGDELVGADAPLSGGQIRRSNDIAIAAALRSRGLQQIVLGHVADEPDATRTTLAALLDEHAVVIITGGVSMGQRDHVPAALDALGVRRVFHRIAQRPGKPMWFGVGRQGQLVFALPGNPVSSLVCAIRHVAPALLSAMGAAAQPIERVRLADGIDTNPALTCFVPVHVRQDETGALLADPVVSPTSGDFAGLVRAHGVVQLPPGQARMPAGTVAQLFRW